MEEKKRKAPGASEMNLLIIHFWVTFILKEKLVSKGKNSSKTTVVESDWRPSGWTFWWPWGFPRKLVSYKDLRQLRSWPSQVSVFLRRLRMCTQIQVGFSFQEKLGERKPIQSVPSARAKHSGRHKDCVTPTSWADDLIGFPDYGAQLMVLTGCAFLDRWLSL